MHKFRNLIVCSGFLSMNIITLYGFSILIPTLFTYLLKQVEKNNKIISRNRNCLIAKSIDTIHHWGDWVKILKILIHDFGWSHFLIVSYKNLDFVLKKKKK